MKAPVVVLAAFASLSTLATASLCVTGFDYCGSILLELSEYSQAFPCLPFSYCIKHNILCVRRKLNVPKRPKMATSHLSSNPYTTSRDM